MTSIGPLERAFGGVAWRAAEVAAAGAAGVVRTALREHGRLVRQLRGRRAGGIATRSRHPLVQELAVLDETRRLGSGDAGRELALLRVVFEAGAYSRAHDLADALVPRLGELGPGPRRHALELALETRLAFGERDEALALAAACRSELAESSRALSLLAAIGDREAEDREDLPDGMPNALGVARRIERGLLDGDDVAALLLGHRARVLVRPELHLLAFMALRHADPPRAADALGRFFRAHGLPRCSIADASGSLLADLGFEPASSTTNGPLVSIIVAAHRAAETIDYAVGSLLDQTYRNVEVLVGDDGSDDGTLDCLRRRHGADPRLRLFASSRNQGPYNVRNELLTRARGDLVTYHDADDLALPTRIETQVRALEAGALASYVCFVRVTRDGRFAFFRDQRALRLCMASLMTSRRVLDQLGPFRPAWIGADLERRERLRHFHGDEALHVVRQPLVLGLWDDGSATRRPGAESREDGYRSPARRAYAERVFEHLCVGTAESDAAITAALRDRGNFAEPPPRPDADLVEVPRDIAGSRRESLEGDVEAPRALRTTALRKTWARVRRSVQRSTRGVHSSAPDRSELEHRFPVFRPHVTRPPKGPRVATILDAFSHECLRYEADVVPLSRESWKREMTDHRPAFLLAESAWRGNDGQWRGLMTRYARSRPNPLRDLLAWCKDNDIPRVFWNKEDPANFDVFGDLAADFDHVFTTDADCVSRYRELLGHRRVYVLEFAAQPAIHNPIRDAATRGGEVCFAGSWRADKYPERAHDTEMLLGAALDLGLEILDRFHGSAERNRPGFPPPFDAAVVGALDHDRMPSAYRAYKVFLNVNSVKSSPTMLSRRVFELLACGTPVVSTDSIGIRETFGSLVKVARTHAEARGHLLSLLGDADGRDRLAHVGYREVMSRHTYSRRLGKILDVLGIAAEPSTPPRVSILATVNHPDRLSSLLDDVCNQTHPAIELVILLRSGRPDPDWALRSVKGIEGARIVAVPESSTLADCLNHGLGHCTGDWVARFDDGGRYGPHYLSDLLLATLFTDAPILGKRTCYSYAKDSDSMTLCNRGSTHRHVDSIHGSTLLLRRHVLDSVKFSPDPRGMEALFFRECRDRGFRIYSADPYNFIGHEESAGRDREGELPSDRREVCTGLDPSQVMV